MKKDKEKDNGRTARRAQLRRILQISERIKTGDYPNCSTIARDLETSSRTIARDIEFLRDEIELPIEFDAKRNGYYYTRTDNKLFQSGIGLKEVEDLVEASHSISQYLGTPMESLLREAFAQMKQDLGLGKVPAHSFNGVLSFRPFAPVKIDIKALQTIGAAVRRERVLRFKYKKPGSDVEEEHTGFPHHVSLINQSWTLFLHCFRKKEVEAFPVYLIRSPEMTDDTFEGPKTFNLDEYLDGRLILAAGTENHEVIVELNDWATDIIRHRHLPAITNIIELPNRCSRVHLRLNTLEEIERWILVLGTGATVLEPPALRDRILKIAEELVRRYATT